MTPEVEYSDAQCEKYTENEVEQEEEYSDNQADKEADEQNEQEQSLAIGYEKFIKHHDRLSESEQLEYRKAIPLFRKLKWAA
jgi:hypothetical protein